MGTQTQGGIAMSRFLRRLAVMSLVVSAWAAMCLAGTTGKIAGTVVDRDTGEPLPWATILVEGTHLGAQASEQGEFFILQVPPGLYSVKAQLLGYVPQVQQQLRVITDLTARVDFELSATVIEAEEEVVVVAERPLVLADVTSSLRLARREEVARMPEIRDFQDVVALQPGTVGRGGGIHVRGGRTGELLYMVDGIPIRHPIYGGTAAFTVPVEAIEEVEILTGGFNAEYGNAQSGVVNVVTREGGKDFSGKLEYETDRHELEKSFKTDYLTFSTGGPELLSQVLLPSIGVRPPGEATHFFSMALEGSDTYLNNHKSRDELDFLGLTFTERQNNELLADGKLTYTTPHRKLKFTLGYRDAWSQYSVLDWAWKDIPDQTQDYTRRSDQWTLTMTHTLTDKTFYSLRFGRLMTRFHSDVNGMAPPDFWEDVWEYVYEDSVIVDSIWAGKRGKYIWWKDAEPDGFMEGPDTSATDPRGASQMRWSDDRSYVYTAKLDATSQVHPQHLVKGGLEFNYHDVRYADIQYCGYQYQPGRDLPGPYPEYGLYRWYFHGFPSPWSAYLQDKMEFEGLIVNAGVRLDYVDPGASVRKDELEEQWEKLTGLPLEVSRYYGGVSPRLGVSHPVTDKMVMYFSYGRFTQFPEFQYYYRDPWTGSWVGNPTLKPEKTTAYEYGFTYELVPDIALDIKAFAKDMRDYAGLIKVGNPPVDVWTNVGYGRSRGAELQLKKRYGNYTSGTVSYTYQWATGFQNSAYTQYVYDELPVRAHRLSWDQRHAVTANLELYAGKGDHPSLLGLRLPDNWTVSLLWKYGSGLPYTPWPTTITTEPNSATAPFTSTFDVKLEKVFDIGTVDVGVFANILNLFDSENLRSLGSLNGYTGDMFAYGDVDEATGEIYSYRDMLYMRNPSSFDAPRQIRLGVNVRW
jgi:outer membrane receptor protein involved in Fe transport